MTTPDLSAARPQRRVPRRRTVVGICLALALVSAGLDRRGAAAEDRAPRVGDLASAFALTFAEEFDDPTIRFPNDRFLTSYVSWGALRSLRGNGELQFYVDRQFFEQISRVPHDPFEVADGILRISAIETPPEFRDIMSQPYLSGVITTDLRFSQLYGYFEFRFRAPVGRGLWPAIWLVGQTHDEHLEIDVMEILGHDPGTVYTSLGAKARGKRFHVRHALDPAADMVTMSVLWEPDRVDWFIEGRRVASTRVDFDVPMYINVNLAVGGNWPGAPDERTAFPAVFAVDYIRVYQRRERLEQ